MIKAAIVAAAFPSEATPGESVRFQITLRNIGDEKGWLVCSIAYFAEGDWQPTYGDFFELDPGQAHIWNLYLTMPSYDIEVWIDASHWDPVAYLAVSDEQKGPYPLAVKEPVVRVGPVPRIMWSLLPQEAQAGSEVTYQAAILNVGDQWGWFRLRATRLKWPYTEASWTDFADLEVGFFKEFTGTFPMPDFNILVELQAEWWDVPAQRWRDGGDPVGYSIAVVRDEWPGVGMPQELWDALSSKWCNVYEGQWVSVTLLGFTFNIPLWSFTPGEWARDAIQWAIGVINIILGSLGEIWVKVQEAWDTAWEAAGAIGDWLAGAFSWFTSQVGDWWGTVWPPIQEFFTTTLDRLNADLAGVGDRVIELNDWLSDLQIDYQSFRINIFKDLFDLDTWKELVAGYNSFREFEGSPLDWAIGRVADFWEGVFNYIYDWLMEEVD